MRKRIEDDVNYTVDKIIFVAVAVVSLFISLLSVSKRISENEDIVANEVVEEVSGNYSPILIADEGESSSFMDLSYMSSNYNNHGRINTIKYSAVISGNAVSDNNVSDDNSSHTIMLTDDKKYVMYSKGYNNLYSTPSCKYIDGTVQPDEKVIVIGEVTSHDNFLLVQGENNEVGYISKDNLNVSILGEDQHIPLTASAGSVIGPSGKETYYNLDMTHIVERMKSQEKYANYEYWIREDGVKMFGPYVMCAANLNEHPRGSIVESSLGQAIVCDTGDFANDGIVKLDIATNW